VARPLVGVPQSTPVVMHPHFTGTGTRHIQDNAKQAIEELMTKSFEMPANAMKRRQGDRQDRVRLTP
jgi:hypothetical protein